MHKLLVVAILCTLILSGCNVHKIPGGEPSPTPTESAMPRLDVSGNPILTEYAEGVFVKAENGILTMKENETERQFRLSERAQRDISVLGIGEGTGIIVNFDETGAEIEEAISLEKLL